MGQFINLLIVLGSLGGIVFILYRKIPLLSDLPIENAGEVKQSAASRVRSQVREKILGTALSKVHVLASKTETQTADWLERLRRKSEQRKKEFQESYWDQLRKKSKDKNNPPE